MLTSLVQVEAKGDTDVYKLSDTVKNIPLKVPQVLQGTRFGRLEADIASPRYAFEKFMDYTTLTPAS